MRAMGIEGSIDFPIEAPIFDWVYQPAIADFSYGDEGSAGTEPALIDDPVAVAALRQAWLEAQELGDSFLAARDEERITYRLFARDVLPFEPQNPWSVELPWYLATRAR